MGLGLGLKRSQTQKRGSDDDDQWYIPYTGPYEPPRETGRRNKARDSWGDPIDDEEDEFDAMLGDKELQKKFPGGYSEYSALDNVKRSMESSRRDTRDRSSSFASGRSHSSGVDPTWGGPIPLPRPKLQSVPRPPAPSYLNTNTSGGVGESPAPHITMKEGGNSSRLSLGSIFSFTSSHKKGAATPKYPADKTTRKPSLRSPRPPKLKATKEAAKVKLELGQPSSSSSESQSSSPRKALLNTAGIPETQKVDDDDYYNTYYSTLLKGPVPEVSPHNPSFGVNPRAVPRPSSGSTVSRQETFSSHSIHPYAYTFPKKEPDPPRTAPLSARDPPQLTFIPPPKDSTVKPPPPTSGLGMKQVKNASSTPNLRASARYDSPRWLSAQTWCDAILFPRPRLKIKEEPLESQPLLSPPITPLVDTYRDKKAPPTAAFQSRVLAHSHSLIDLSLQNRDRRRVPEYAGPSKPRAKHEKAPRPRSFAQDDMSMIHPVLSLERVLEEGQELESERKQWQRQAAASLGNTRARTLSRTRAKSLTQKGRIQAGGHRVHNSFDYLAARACLGSQNLTPVLPARSHTTSLTDTTGLSSYGQSSHVHSNSTSKSKSSQIHSRGHSRDESWGKSVLKQIKGAPHNAAAAPADDMLAGSEGTLRRDDAKIQLSYHNLALSPLDNSAHQEATRISPTPSGISSDVQMGIAISTPPLVGDVLDREYIRMPTHPYAQAAASSVPRKTEVAANNGQLYHALASPPISTPERPTMSSHPYALALEPDDNVGFVAHARSDANVSPQSKMWAQLSPGVVREVLPSDFRYSPFFNNHDSTFPADRSSIVGIGEALTYASYRDSRDSGLGTSETHIVQPARATPLGLQKYTPQPRASNDGQRSHREPVQYDASQPIYAHHRGRSADLSVSTAFPSPRVPFMADRLPPRADLAPVSPSPIGTSGSPSPRLSPHSLGSPNDLDSFHDLFYKPTAPSTPMEKEDHPMSSSSGPLLTSEIALRSRRTGSGLTSLARQLSEEYEHMERERTNSQYSYSSSSGRAASGLVRRPTNSSLKFVFEEMPRSASPMAEEVEEGEEVDPDATEVFKPAFRVPEDVHSSASSIVERPVEDEDDTAMFRVGVVESVSTPPAETAARRRSYTGFLSEEPEHFHFRPQQQDLAPPSSTSDKHHSTLLSPATDMTRSSYMTTSTSGSRMSNLSDFPVPPRDGPMPPGHMSFLSSFHDTTLNHRELETVRDSPHPMHPHDRRFTFGFDQDAADVADELSNQDH